MPASRPVRILRAAALLAAAALTAVAAPVLGAPAHAERRLAPGPPRTPGGAGGAGAVPDRVVVVWRDGVTRPRRAAASDGANAGFVGSLGGTRFQVLRPQPGQSVAETVAALRRDPAVQSATPDLYDVPQATTNDPLFGDQWGLQNLGLGIEGFGGALAGADVDALAAWDRTRGTPGTVVADIDSGYRFEQPDLAPVAWTNPADGTHGYDFVGSDADSPTTDTDPTDDDLVDGGHGVHTAGIVGAAGNNGIGVSGVAQDVRIMPLRVCAYSTSAQATRCPLSSEIAAINYAGAHGARVANLSLGRAGASDPTELAAFAANPQVLFVVSAGNDGVSNDAVPHYPCDYDPATSGVPGAVDNVVCVAALDQADRLASFSDWGPSTVDVGAPGTQILSTYPWDTAIDETFAVDDFASKWSATGLSGGFARTHEAPLTSWGMSDSPGAAPAPLSVRASTSAPVTLPPGLRSCELDQTRWVSLGTSGTYTYSVLLDGVPIASASPSSSGSFFLPLDAADDPAAAAALAAGGRLQVSFSYSAGAVPSASDGVWLTDIVFRCMEPVGRGTSYGYLDGTSMAAPFVTGAAALLFSLNPAASVTQVRAALLETVHPVASLAGRTTSGGRIDAAAALDEIRQPDTRIVSGAHGTTGSRRATFSFARADVALPGSFQCQLDGGPFGACASPASYTVGGGRHTFAVRSLSPRGIVADPSPATATWTVIQCKVPKLANLTLSHARRALSKAHCQLGKVVKPRARKGHRPPPLVVRATSPKAGAIRAAGAKIRLTLGPKPKPKPRKRRTRR
ncbi:MAG TPA: S8 family serine peptidase [Conexibacter sp.]|nr:S8 family serine peptidase [Conexibacter sp.]